MYVGNVNDFSENKHKKRISVMKVSGKIRDNYEKTAKDWKTQFLDLYMSGDVKEFGQALELKRQHIPEKLYRYRTLVK